MPFDANLVLVDGSADWSKTNIDSYGTPTSTTRNDGGFAVIDLLASAASGYAAGGGESGAKGLSAVFICDEAGAATDDALTLTIEGCDAEAFGSAVHELASFDILAANAGIIIGSECPCVVVRHFTTQWRYIRAKAAVTAADDFHTCYVLLTPYPFKTL